MLTGFRDLIKPSFQLFCSFMYVFYLSIYLFFVSNGNLSDFYSQISRFVLAAVTPAVVVPSMLNLADKGYGTDKGIPTLVIAAASVDDVLAITGFGVMLGIAFSEGEE